ncbi:hypothetical protein MASR1M90_14720 [Desulfovibrionales bacterium]
MLNHVLYASNSKLPSRHANSVQVAHMICALAPLVHNLDVYLADGFSRVLNRWTGRTFTHYGLHKPANAHIHFVTNRRARPFGSAALAALPSKADLLITRSAPLALAWAEQGRPVLFESHVPPRDASAVSIPSLITGINTAPGAGLVAISEAVGATYLSWGLREQKLLIAHDGVDLAAFARPVHRQADPHKSGALARLFGPRIHERPVMLYTGSLSPQKGALFLAQAAAFLPDIHIALVGGTAEECAALRTQTGPGVFIHSSVAHKAIPALLHDADMLVMPYLDSGDLIPFMSPLKLFEYLASGTPVLSADVPVLRSVLDPGQNCQLFTPGSVHALGLAVQTLTTMTEPERQALQLRQENTAASYTWAKRAQNILAWQKELCAGGCHD